LSWIVGSTILVSVSARKIIDRGSEKKGPVPESDVIAYLIQTGTQKEALLSDYLAECLDLSIDRPTPFSSFDPDLASLRLKQSPLIADAAVKKMKPNIAYIEYRVRKPKVRCLDFFNAAIDAEGILFPIHPFFSPKKMTDLYLGEKGVERKGGVFFGSSLQGPVLELAFSVCDFFEQRAKDLFFVERIDVSESGSPSLGRREIVVILENELSAQDSPDRKVSRHFLRLTTKRFREEIENYLRLRPKLLESERGEPEPFGACQDKVVDLRLSRMAFIGGT
jgi:hypothetical protein